MNGFRLLCVLLAVSLCSLCICADDSLPDQMASGDSGIGNTEQLEISEDEHDISNDDSELRDDVGYYDTLIVNDLIIEEDEAAAVAEIYSIAPNVQYGAYFHANISYFGDCYIYIPVAYASDSFSYNDDGIPINITSASITGYISGESSSQSIHFPAFGLPRYRLGSGVGYDYTDITRWEDLGSTVAVYTSDDNFYSYSEVYFLRFVVLLLAIDVVLNLFVRLLGGVRH